MRYAASTLVLFGISVLAVPAAAQVRPRPPAAVAVPPGFLPPPGACRVWYDYRTPARQPGPMSCRDAERLAARDRGARVIYGPPVADRYRDVPRYSSTYGDRYPRAGAPYEGLGFDQGYRDGYEKGLEDARDRDSYDPVRHRWYRNSDRGYDRRFGPRDGYKLAYREGFASGYDRGYRGAAAFPPGYRPDRSGIDIWFRWRR